MSVEIIGNPWIAFEVPNAFQDVPTNITEEQHRVIMSAQGVEVYTNLDAESGGRTSLFFNVTGRSTLMVMFACVLGWGTGDHHRLQYDVATKTFARVSN